MSDDLSPLSSPSPLTVEGSSMKPLAGAVSSSQPSNLQVITAKADTPRPSPKTVAKTTEPAKTPRKKGMIDTLVARDQTSVFWFLVACVVAGGCAWYLVIMAEALKARPPFVVMDTSGAYYVVPGLNFDTMTPMHVDLTRVAVETIFERGPQGLVNADRVGRLFGKTGTVLLKDILNKEENYFRNQQVEQTVQLEGDPIVRKTLPTAVATEAQGLVTRRSFFKGQPQLETYRFKVLFIWMMNPDMRSNRAYPSVVERIPTYSLEKISDS